MPIHQRLFDVLKNTGYVQKTGKNNEQRYSYASDADMLREVRPAMVAAGVLCYPIQFEQHVGKTPSEKQVLVNGNATFRFQDAEDGSYIDIVAPFCGADSTDKAGLKAATAARKYALKLAFSLETGDDPERDEPAPRSSLADASAKVKATADAAKAPSEAWLTHGQVRVRDITPVESAAYADQLSRLGITNAEACKLIGVKSMKEGRPDSTLNDVITEVASVLALRNAGTKMLDEKVANG